MDRDAAPSMNPNASGQDGDRGVTTDNNELQQLVMNPYIEVVSYNLEEEKRRNWILYQK